mmetsp:Transcript_29655/g.30788  ORF Transcript_29655/g.30788 Transcript_29655/m.30788 type:complete len:345 (+) Transcript_29655:57-1091(+)
MKSQRNSLFRRKATYAFISISLLSIKKYCSGPEAKKKDLSGKLVVVTGASDGIGIPTTEQLLKSGAKVILACRNEKKTQNMISRLDKTIQSNASFMKLDLSSFKSVKDFSDEFTRKHAKLDILVNNAGIFSPSYITTEDGIESTLQVNTLSPMLLTNQLLPLIEKAEGRIVNLSSLAHKDGGFTPETAKQWMKDDKIYNQQSYSSTKQYSFSKLGNVYFTQYLKEYCESKNIKVLTGSVHPGVIHTGLSRDLHVFFKVIGFVLYPLALLTFKSPYRGAQTSLHLCYLDSKDFKNGEYYSDCAVGYLYPQAQFSEKEKRYSYMEWARSTLNKHGEKHGYQYNISL